MTGIEKVAVIGSGVMGAGIAAHFANAGADVLLLDIVPEGADDPSALAKGAIARMSKGRAQQLAHPDYVSRLTPGNLRDDLPKLSECDWVVEVVLEDLSVKRELYARIAPYLAGDAILSSNTSTIPLSDLTRDLDESLRNRFLISHFFNPPRHMRLIELVSGADTQTEVVARATEYADRCLGKTVVPCNDRPGFIANRLGGFWMNIAAREATLRGISVEEADAVLSRPFGIPKTGIFGLMDLIGIDLMEKSRLSMRSLLGSDDPQHKAGQGLRLFQRMADQGLSGRKSGAGFFRHQKSESGQRFTETLDLDKLDYRPYQSVKTLDNEFGSSFIERTEDRLAEYAWAVMGPTLAYAAWCVPEITTNPADVDKAMELGYNWRMGPFRLIDRIGADRIVARLKAQGQDVPPLLQLAAERGGIYQDTLPEKQVLLASGETTGIPRPDGVVFASDLTGRSLLQSDAGELRDMGDGIALFTIASRNAALDDLVMKSLSEALDVIPGKFKGLVIGSDNAHFSVGADLKKALSRADEGALDQVSSQLEVGQETLRQMKYAPFPVVSAACGLALGGGCEILMHSDRVVAHLESTIGLVEANVGLIPAWGGTTALLLEMTERTGDSTRGAAAAFDVIANALMMNSAPLAQTTGYLRDSDRVVMNRDRLLAHAKAETIVLADGYAPPTPAEITIESDKVNAVLEPRLKALAEACVDSPYTVEIARELAGVLAGGRSTGRFGEEALHRLEAAAMMRLIRQEQTLARMRHTMTTGKTLKN